MRLVRSLPALSGTLHLRGLAEQVDVYRDTHGIPHIYAQNRRDLMFAVGFVTAQDRLWQMDLIRRVATGRLAEIVGEGGLRNDLLMRAIGLERTAQRQFESLSPESAVLLTAFCEGVNTCIENLRSLPPEFRLLKYHPEPWRPSDSLAISRLLGWQLSKNYESEIVLMKIAGKVGSRRAMELSPAYPSDGPSILPSDTLEDITESEILEGAQELDEIIGAPGGSNSWVIGPSRSASGAPILANDPHLSGTWIPSIWYYVHLTGGGFDVIGALVPGTPLPLLGHNRRIGWGLTNMTADVQDIYIERVDPNDLNQYEYNGAWVDMDTLLEKIPFRTSSGETSFIQREIRRTIHGPVINDAVPKALKVISLSWTGLEPTPDFEALLGVNLAKDWNDFRSALESFGVAPQNFIYADTSGNIGYYGAGIIPTRPSGNGMFPQDGWTSATRWGDRIPFEQMPHAFNPPAGYIVTANNRVVGDEYPHFLSAEWAPGFRSRRIIELLGERKAHDAQSMARMQSDSVSLLAKFICETIEPALAGVREADQRKAARLLAEWDYDNTVKSAAALIYHEFLITFARNTFSDELGKTLANEYLDQYYLWLERFVQFVEEDSPWFDDRNTQKVETRDDIVVRSFAEAVESLQKKYGADMDGWRWGNVHRGEFHHPLDKSALVKWLFNPDPFPFPGDGETINRGTFDFNKPYEVTMAASIRHIMDFSHLENTLGIHTTGQSGHFLSPHYDDLAELWLKGKYISLPMNKEEYQRRIEGYLRLLPATAP
jgi:penicillin amidase